MTPTRKTCLIVDDNALVSRGLAVLLERFGFEVCGIARDASSAISMAREHTPDIILMDVRLNGDRDGIDAAIEIGEMLDARIIFVTAEDTPQVFARMNRSHPHRVLSKPVSGAELQSALTA